MRLAEDESNWKQVILQASNFIVQRKGKGMLVERGSTPLLAEMRELEGELDALVEAAGKTAEQMELERLRAARAMDEFENKADGVRERFKRAFKYPPNYAVAAEDDESLYGKLCVELESNIKSEAAQKNLTETLFKVLDEIQYERELVTRIPNEVKTFIERKILGWQKRVQEGKSTEVREDILEQVKNADAEMSRLLQDALTEGGSLLKGMELGNLAPELTGQIDTVAWNYVGFWTDWFWNEIEKKPIVGWIARHMRDAYEGGRGYLLGDTFDRKAHRKKISEGLPNFFDRDDVHLMIRRNVGALLEAYSVAIDTAIDKQIARCHKTYDERVKETQAVFTQSQANRAEIENRTRKFKEEVIIPFRKKLAEFQQKIEASIKEIKAFA